MDGVVAVDKLEGYKDQRGALRPGAWLLVFPATLVMPSWVHLGRGQPDLHGARVGLPPMPCNPVNR